MKKTLMLIAALGLALPMHAGRKKAQQLEVLEDRGFNTTNYSHLKVGQVLADDFLDSIKNIKNYDAVAGQIDDMDTMLKAYLGKYAREEFQGGKGGRTLVVTADLVDYNAGSTAAAVWVGMGAGNGHCAYEIHFWDGKRDVASFKTTQRILRTQHGGWGRQDFSGEGSREQIPKNVVDLVDQFLNDH
jgi:hypothetical protein